MQDIFALESYNYVLPEDRIAQYPTVPAHNAKLLVCAMSDRDIHFSDTNYISLADTLTESDILFLNDSYVVKARIALKDLVCERLYSSGKKQKRVLGVGEIFVYEIYDSYSFACLVSDGKHFRPGTTIHYSDTISFVSERFVSDGIQMRIVGMSLFSFLETYGQMPLPPYVAYSSAKETFYQTDFADISKQGSVAAPTAGLHFTTELLQKLSQKNISIEKISLSVSLGTFKPIFEKDIRDFSIHGEKVSISKDIFARIYNYKQQGKSIVAVGTTVARTLESLPYLWSLFSVSTKQKHFTSDVIYFWDISLSETHMPYVKKYISDFSFDLNSISFVTRIYMYPGFARKVVDTLITNFHLPKTSLLLLVASFMGYQNWKQSYEYAIANAYRFYSFGDGMMVKKI